MLKFMFRSIIKNIQLEFFRDEETQKIYVYNCKEMKFFGFKIYKKEYIFFHEKKEYEAIEVMFDIAEHYDDYLAGKWNPAPVEKNSHL